MAIKLSFNLPPEIHEDVKKIETISTSTVMEDAEPGEVAAVIEDLHARNFDLDIRVRAKEPK